MTSVESLSGLVLVVVIAGLLLIEETGIPLLFAPGDILLAIGGIAIAAGRVQPWVFIPVAAGAILAGAMLDRELFAVIGLQRASRLARRLRAEHGLERVARMLETGGWRAVFIARLIPGFRVHSSQVAGLTQMPRRTFFGGLLAATGVYVAAFVGLGAALGHPILHLIHQGEREAVLGGALLAGLAVVILILRQRVQSAVVSLDLAQWTEAFRWRRPSTAALSLIPVAIGLDYAGHALVKGMSLPLFIDSTGTILVGLLAGPWIGGLAGFLANLISASTVDPVAAPYSAVSLLLGFVAGVAGYLRWPAHRIGWVALALLCFGIASIGSVPLNLALYQGHSGVWLGDAIDEALVGAHFPTPLAAYLGEAAIDLPDKLLTVLFVFTVYRALPWPRSSRARLLRPKTRRRRTLQRGETSPRTPVRCAGGIRQQDSGPECGPHAALCGAPEPQRARRWSVRHGARS